jgi:hypothetical protein
MNPRRVRRPAPHPPEGTLAPSQLAALARARLAGAVGVARWADAALSRGGGADGHGPLSPATAERAADALGTTTSQVCADWDTARLAGLIEVHGDRALPGWRLRAWDRDDTAVLRGWVALFDAWSLACPEPPGHEAAEVAEVVSAMPQVLSFLQLSAEQVPVGQLLDLLRQRVTELRTERCEISYDPRPEPEPGARLESAVGSGRVVEAEPAVGPEAEAQLGRVVQPESAVWPGPVVQPGTGARPEPVVQPEAGARPEPVGQPGAVGQPGPVGQPEPTVPSASVEEPDVVPLPGTGLLSGPAALPEPAAPVAPVEDLSLAPLLDWALGALASVGALTYGAGQATLTPLGSWAVWVKLEQICVAAQSPAGNIEQAAEDMLRGCARLRPGEARAEYRAWLAARPVGAAVAELLDASRGEDALLRGLAFEALRVVGAPAEPEVRAAAGEVHLRPYALLWLAEHDGADPEEAHAVLTREEATWLWVDSAAAVADHGEAPMLVRHLESAVQPTVPQFLEEVRAVGHPRTVQVLVALAAAHPDPALAKALRRAAFQVHTGGN